MLTEDNIQAINDFLRRYKNGERNFLGTHKQTEFSFATALRKLGVELPRRCGCKHSEEFKQKMGIKSRERWNRMTEQQREERLNALRASHTPEIISRRDKKASERMKSVWAVAKAAKQQAAE